MPKSLGYGSRHRREGMDHSPPQRMVVKLERQDHITTLAMTMKPRVDLSPASSQDESPKATKKWVQYA